MKKILEKLPYGGDGRKPKKRVGYCEVPESFSHQQHLPNESDFYKELHDKVYSLKSMRENSLSLLDVFPKFQPPIYKNGEMVKGSEYPNYIEGLFDSPIRGEIVATPNGVVENPPYSYVDTNGFTRVFPTKGTRLPYDGRHCKDAYQAYKEALSYGYKSFVYNGFETLVDLPTKYDGFVRFFRRKGYFENWDKKNPNKPNPWIVLQKREQMRLYGITDDRLINKNARSFNFINNEYGFGYDVPRFLAALNGVNTNDLFIDEVEPNRIAEKYLYAGFPIPEKYREYIDISDYRVNSNEEYNFAQRNINTFDDVKRNIESANKYAEHDGRIYRSFIHYPDELENLVTQLSINGKSDSLSVPQFLNNGLSSIYSVPFKETDAVRGHYPKKYFNNAVLKKDSIFNVLGPVTTLGNATNGRNDVDKYYSYYDEWNLNPLEKVSSFDFEKFTDFGKPFNYYDRQYDEDVK